MRHRRLVIALFALLPLGACATKPGPTSLDVPAGRYPAAFQAAKDALRDAQFELDRIDATSGVITTHPRASSGLATPWIPQSSSLSDAWEGFVERERRTAIITFESAPQSQTDAPAGTPAIDPALRTEPLPDPTGALTAKVDVRVARVYRPGRRVDSTGVRLMTFSSDPELVAQGLEPAFSTEIRSDEALASRLATAIGASLNRPAAKVVQAPPPAPEPLKGAPNTPEPTPSP